MDEEEIEALIDWSCPWVYIDLCVFRAQEREYFFGKEVDITPHQMEVLLDFAKYRADGIKYVKVKDYENDKYVKNEKNEERNKKRTENDKKRAVAALQKNIERLNEAVRKKTRRKIIRNKRGKGYSLNVRNGVRGVFIK